MFDLTSGTIERPFRDRHASATVLSVSTHVALIGSVAWVVLFSVPDTLPQVPTMMAFVATAPAPPPPPPPPAPKRVNAAQPSKPIPTTGPTFTVPTEVPVGIQPESGIDLDGEGGVVGGVEGGVEGGIPGGVLGGLLGALITEAPPPPPPPAKPRRVGGEIQAPALLKRVEPEYPGVAVSGKISGTVILEATVDEAGAVTEVTVLRPIAVLDRAAIKAVKQWRYEPLMLNGQPVPFILVVTLTFTLR